MLYKSLYLLVCMGKEKKFVEETLKLRVDAAEDFAIQGKSMTVAALQKRENIEMYNGAVPEGVITEVEGLDESYRLQ